MRTYCSSRPRISYKFICSLSLSRISPPRFYLRETLNASSLFITFVQTSRRDFIPLPPTPSFWELKYALASNLISIKAHSLYFRISSKGSSFSHFWYFRSSTLDHSCYSIQGMWIIVYFLLYKTMYHFIRRILFIEFFKCNYFYLFLYIIYSIMYFHQVSLCGFLKGTDGLFCRLF